MRVAAVQFKPAKGDKAGSLRRLARLAERVAPGADLLVLPEMAAAGYVFASRDAVEPVAEAPRGETFHALAPLARTHGCWLVVGLPERDGDVYFNSALVIDPRGELAFTYRKTLLYETDEAWAEPGDSGYATFDAAAGRFTVGICMDLNDDRFITWCAGCDARALAFPTNWLHEGTSVWPYWAWRLDGIDIGVVAANTWGVEEHIRFRGTSAIVDRRTVLAAAPEEGDAALQAVLPP